ncbi:MAG TPA: ATP-binding protein [Candidatus Limnocylindrales bacterium]|nr:ATP-binding protein [Candidatus Limnocylindrales bacterium]
MPLARRDLFALAIVVGATVASLVVWDYGRVDIGMTLRADRDRVVVQDVTPDGNAARNDFSPGISILDLATTDGVDVKRGEPVGVDSEGWAVPEVMPWEHLGPIGGELLIYDRTYRLPIEAVDSARIASAVAGEIDVAAEVGWINAYASVDRDFLEFLLRQSIWMVALGIGVGILLWRLLVHGIAGSLGRDHAVLLGAAVATPFVLLPVLQVGAPVGIYAGYLVPAALALALGLSLARTHPDPAWVQTARAATVVAAGLAAILVVRYMTSSALAPNDRGAILLMITAIAAVPAVISAMAQPGVRQRASQMSVALIPGAALSLIGPSTPEPILPLVLLTALLGWQLLPVDRGLAAIGAGLGRMRTSRADAPVAEPVLATWRDRLTYALMAVVVVAGITQYNSWAVILGVGLAALVGFAVRRGFLGGSWTDAAVPLAAAVGIPVTLLAFNAWDYGFEAMGWTGAATALAAVSVAHVLASRHSDEVLRGHLFVGSVALAGVTILLGGMNLPLALVMSGLVALIPGLPVAFADEPGETRALTSRLETLAIALTPGAAATVLVPGTAGILLGAWLVALVVWRRFTLAPLLGLAQRSQLQRDVAVAAAETERARLAADLHDDALQQLTMLVRTLDESGQADAAAEAREVATKLRSIVGDLRLPILDDLGAGAALEWLVERFEPLAGGAVKLERSDASRPPANVELAVFRVAQEALTNAIRHGSTPIAVRYDVSADGRVTLAIDDAGAGIGENAAVEAPKEGHFGLLNMQQRAEQIGALLDVRRWPAGGTRVALEWRPQ